jgi:NAD(P)H-hydrate epimerase
LGTAIRATQTLCLGLWKQGLLQDHALEWVGVAELVDFGLPLADILAVLNEMSPVRRITAARAIRQLPLHRPAATHKYKMGHLLLVCGSRRYAGGALLTGLGARASGVGMLSIAAPAALKPLLTAQLPEALVLDCPETESGAIQQFPDGLDLSSYHAIACGPGLTLDAPAVVQSVLDSDCPLVLDADGLNLLAQQGTVPTLQQRSALTILTPHLGEFKRLFPEIATDECRIRATQQAAQDCGAIVLLKGARVAIAAPTGAVWINPDSSAALARGGSGDVLTGLTGGLLAQAASGPAIAGDAALSVALSVVQSAAWWHAQAGVWAANARSQLGVDAWTLSQALIPALQQSCSVTVER